MKSLFFLFILFAVFGCAEPSRTVVAKGTNEKHWDEMVSLWYNNQDTLRKREISLMIRYNDRFDGTTVRVALCVVSPSKKLFRDTLTVNVDRKAQTNGFKVEEFYTPIFKNARLSDKGEYCFSFEPLNNPPLAGITGIGILF